MTTSKKSRWNPAYVPHEAKAGLYDKMYARWREDLMRIEQLEAIIKEKDALMKEFNEAANELLAKNSRLRATIGEKEKELTELRKKHESLTDHVQALSRTRHLVAC